GVWTDADGKAAGLASHLDHGQQARAVRGGVTAVTPRQGMALFAEALRQRESHLIPVPLDLRAMRRSFDEGVPSVWRSLVEVPRHVAERGNPRNPESPQNNPASWVEELRALPEVERMS